MMSRVCFERMLAEEPGIAVKLAGREPLLLAKSGRRWLGKRTSVDLGSPGALVAASACVGMPVEKAMRVVA